MIADARTPRLTKMGSKKVSKSCFVVPNFYDKNPRKKNWIEAGMKLNFCHGGRKERVS
jgi:hypothetical protein